MKHFAILALLALAATGYGQSVRYLGHSTSGAVVYTNPNALTFSNTTVFNNTTTFNAEVNATNVVFTAGANALQLESTGITFGGAAGATTRSNLGLPLAALTNTNAANFQGAIFAATNAAPTNTTNVNAWINLNVGTNTFKLPLYK
jgi:hypothetical protein